jgi:ketosteroid isomerase-like protein
MKRTLLLLVLLAPVLFFLPACEGEHEEMEHQAEQLDMDAVKAEIQAMEDAYAVAENNKDADGVVAYYADDAQSLAYNAPTDVGKEAIKASILKGFEEDTMGNTISFQVTGVWAAGDYATETGTSKTVDKDGNVVRTGKYMTLFEKRDGKYVAIRDCYNRDDDPCK